MGTKISLHMVYNANSRWHSPFIASSPLSIVTHSIRLAAFFVVALCTLTLTGCLTAEKKEVHLSLNEDGKSGTGKIIFRDISSTPGDSMEVVKEDFNTLIAEYYQGRKIELENKGMRNVRKKLFKQNGKLVGEIEFDFDDIAALGITRYKNAGPYMFYTIADGFFTSGQYLSSNGTYMGEKMPVIFWDSSERDLEYQMTLSPPQEPKKSLLPNFTSWEGRQH
jgi:hypothetical protein